MTSLNTLWAGYVLFIALIFPVCTGRIDSTVAFSLKALSSTGVGSISMTFGLNEAQSSWLSLLCHQQHTSSKHTALQCCLSIFSKQHREINKHLAIGEKHFEGLDVLFTGQRFLRGAVLIENNWWVQEEQAPRYELTSVNGSFLSHPLSQLQFYFLTKMSLNGVLWLSSCWNPDERREVLIKMLIHWTVTFNYYCP